MDWRLMMCSYKIPAVDRHRQLQHAYTIRDRNKIRVAHSLEEIPVDGRHWIAVLNLLLHEFNHRHAVKDKGVSFKTMHERKEFLFRFFRTLRDIGYNLDPRSLGNRHVQAVVDLWIKDDLSSGTMQNYLSYLRAFADWIGKPGMVMEPGFYFDDSVRIQRTYVAVQDKTWAAHNINADEMIALVSEYDPYAGVWLAVIAAFGLRCREAQMLQPHLAVISATNTGIETPIAEWYLNATRGSKGGRPRFIPIDSQYKWDAIELAKRIASAPNGHLGHPHYPSLKAGTRRYRFVMERFGITKKVLGVTPHGLRHQYANNLYKTVTETPAPVCGGSGIDPVIDKQARLQVSAELGHARAQISSAYLGGVLQKTPVIDTPSSEEGNGNE
jgi:integrase